MKCCFQNLRYIALFVCNAVAIWGKKKKDNDGLCPISEKKKKYVKPEIQLQVL